MPTVVARFRRAIDPLRHLVAFARYPGWLEIVIGVGGGVLWSILAFFSGVTLDERPGMYLTVFFTPFAYFWEMVGVLMAAIHGYMLAAENQRGRAWTVAATCAFWSHVTYSVSLQALARDLPIPMTAVATALLALISFVLTVRLWKGYS
ncbi:hypothetical protein [Teichococcus oryzae]|uniref:Uncharacterized protein n=1 Tax=Teichococcus oryzae TaxID=1608942 RepID=A0A5B2TB58_9PROT|nr:hypothetical protein [Pseudoroseomonas oryzae]KAA2211313.1 hypothetical protein F0Q34_20705 [Pseudoroseomonas oryzae]